MKSFKVLACSLFFVLLFHVTASSQESKPLPKAILSNIKVFDASKLGSFQKYNLYLKQDQGRINVTLLPKIENSNTNTEQITVYDEAKILVLKEMTVVFSSSNLNYRLTPDEKWNIDLKNIKPGTYSVYINGKKLIDRFTVSK